MRMLVVLAVVAGFASAGPAAAQSPLDKLMPGAGGGSSSGNIGDKAMQAIGVDPCMLTVDPIEKAKCEAEKRIKGALGGTQGTASPATPSPSTNPLDLLKK